MNKIDKVFDVADLICTSTVWVFLTIWIVVYTNDIAVKWIGVAAICIALITSFVARYRIKRGL